MLTSFYQEAYDHERIRNILKRAVLAWQRALSDQGLAPATVNNYLASLSGFTTWVHAQAPHLFAVGDPAKLPDAHRQISPLRPHDLRHTFAFHLAQVTGADAYELERRLGHRSQRYIQRYTNPPEAVAASYVEEF